MAPRVLRRVVEFMHANMDKPIGLKDLADCAGLSLSHFSLQFRASTIVSLLSCISNSHIRSLFALTCLSRQSTVSRRCRASGGIPCSLLSVTFQFIWKFPRGRAICSRGTPYPNPQHKLWRLRDRAGLCLRVHLLPLGQGVGRNQAATVLDRLSKGARCSGHTALIGKETQCHPGGIELAFGLCRFGVQRSLQLPERFLPPLGSMSAARSCTKSSWTSFEVDRDFGSGLSVSPDGRWIMSSQLGDVNSDSMLVDHFH
jgi:hypothetical protein